MAQGPRKERLDSGGRPNLDIDPVPGIFLKEFYHCGIRGFGNSPKIRRLADLVCRLNECLCLYRAEALSGAFV